MTATSSGVPLGAWLADLDDDALIRLLQLRPDLSQPPPGTIAALAARATSRQSVKAATDSLDFLHLAVLDALLVLHADTGEVPVTEVTTLLGDRVDGLRAERRVLQVDRFATAAEFLDFFKQYYGPTIAVYKAISGDPDKVAALDRDLADLAREFDVGDGSFAMDWEYLLLTAHERA